MVLGKFVYSVDNTNTFLDFFLLSWAVNEFVGFLFGLVGFLQQFAMLFFCPPFGSLLYTSSVFFGTSWFFFGSFIVFSVKKKKLARTSTVIKKKKKVVGRKEGMHNPYVCMSTHVGYYLH